MSETKEFRCDECGEATEFNNRFHCVTVHEKKYGHSKDFHFCDKCWRWEFKKPIRGILVKLGILKDKS